MKNSYKKLIIGLCCIMFLSSCGTVTLDEEPEQESTNTSETLENLPLLSGQVLIPDNINNPELSNSEVPVSEAEIKLYDTITHQEITPPNNANSWATTSSTGHFSIDLNTKDLSKDFTQILVKAVKTNESNSTTTAAYAPDITKEKFITLNATSTLITTLIQTPIIETCGDLLSKVKTLPTEKKALLKTQIKTLHEKYTKHQDKITKYYYPILKTPINSEATEEENHLYYLLSCKDKATRFIYSKPSIEQDTNSTLTTYKEIITSTLLACELPENLKLTKLIDTYNTEENQIQLPDNLILPKGTECFQGTKLPTTLTILPENSILHKGFSLPKTVKLNTGTILNTDYEMPTDYAHKEALPNINIKKGVKLAPGTKLHTGITYETGYKLPKVDDINLGSDLTIKKEITEFDSPINNSIRDKLASDYEFTNDYKSNLATEFRYNNDLLSKLHTDFKFNSSDRELLDTNIKFKKEHASHLENQFINRYIMENHLDENFLLTKENHTLLENGTKIKTSDMSRLDSLFISETTEIYLDDEFKISNLDKSKINTNYLTLARLQKYAETTGPNPLKLDVATDLTLLQTLEKLTTPHKPFLENGFIITSITDKLDSTNFKLTNNDKLLIGSQFISDATKHFLDTDFKLYNDNTHLIANGFITEENLNLYFNSVNNPPTNPLFKLKVSDIDLFNSNLKIKNNQKYRLENGFLTKTTLPYLDKTVTDKIVIEEREEDYVGDGFIDDTTKEHINFKLTHNHINKLNPSFIIPITELSDYVDNNFITHETISKIDTTSGKLKTEHIPLINPGFITTETKKYLDTNFRLGSNTDYILDSEYFFTKEDLDTGIAKDYIITSPINNYNKIKRFTNLSITNQTELTTYISDHITEFSDPQLYIWTLYKQRYYSKLSLPSTLPAIWFNSLDIDGNNLIDSNTTTDKINNSGTFDSNITLSSDSPFNRSIETINENEHIKKGRIIIPHGQTLKSHSSSIINTHTTYLSLEVENPTNRESLFTFYNYNKENAIEIKLVTENTKTKIQVIIKENNIIIGNYKSTEIDLSSTNNHINLEINYNNNNLSVNHILTNTTPVFIIENIHVPNFNLIQFKAGNESNEGITNKINYQDIIIYDKEITADEKNQIRTYLIKQYTSLF